MLIQIRTIIALVGLLLLMACIHAKATVISLETNSLTLNQQENFTVELWARQLNSEIISAFSLDIAFDENNLQIQQVSFADELGAGLDSLQSETTTTGLSMLSELSFLSDIELNQLQNGDSVRLAVLEFRTLFAGTTSLSINNVNTIGSNFMPLMASVAPPLEISIEAQAVSAPKISLLLFLALALLSFNSRLFKTDYRSLRA